MNNLRTYILENKDSFKQEHYIAMCQIISDIPINDMPIRQPLVRSDRVITPMRRYTISLQEWEFIKYHISGNDYHNGMSQPLFNCLYGLFENTEWVQTFFTFPDCLTWNERQRFHIMGNIDNFYSHTYQNKLTIIIN